jgi:hypothetical protein
VKIPSILLAVGIVLLGIFLMFFYLQHHAILYGIASLQLINIFLLAKEKWQNRSLALMLASAALLGYSIFSIVVSIGLSQN